jgi:hypothetical protein
MTTMPPVRLSRSEPVEFHLKCKGLRQEELTGLYRDFQNALGERPAFRNPTPPLFDAQAIHELLVRVPWTVIGSVAGTRALNKAVDILAGIIERKLTGGNEDHKKTVKILGPDGRVVIEVIATPEKKKLK